MLTQRRERIFQDFFPAKLSSKERFELAVNLWSARMRNIIVATRDACTLLTPLKNDGWESWQLVPVNIHGEQKRGYARKNYVAYTRTYTWGRLASTYVSLTHPMHVHTQWRSFLMQEKGRKETAGGLTFARSLSLVSFFRDEFRLSREKGIFIELESETWRVILFKGTTGSGDYFDWLRINFISTMIK